MEKLKICFFASHSGSNMQAIIDSVEQGLLDAELKCLITNNSNCYAIQRAINHNIPYYHVSSAKYPDQNGSVNRIIEIINELKVNTIVLAGYMKLLPIEIIKQVNGRVLNIHPALLPKFGGEGMWGMNVHKAVIESGETESGPTVHLVDSEYDRGRILGNKKLKLNKDETPETLASRVLELEHKLYSEILIKISKGEIAIP